jgi:hypothetical protein
MDRFTRNYLIFLGLLGAGALAWWISSWNPRVGEINDLLEADPKLSAYPYQFRVVSLEKGIAKISSPRSFDVPVIKFLAAIRPDLAHKPQDHPEVMAAQAELATHQKRAGKLVQEQADVKQVRWTLDRDWWAERGVFVK